MFDHIFRDKSTIQTTGNYKNAQKYYYGQEMKEELPHWFSLTGKNPQKELSFHQNSIRAEKPGQDGIVHNEEKTSEKELRVHGNPRRLLPSWHTLAQWQCRDPGVSGR